MLEDQSKALSPCILMPLIPNQLTRCAHGGQTILFDHLLVRSASTKIPHSYAGKLDRCAGPRFGNALSGRARMGLFLARSRARIRTLISTIIPCSIEGGPHASLTRRIYPELAWCLFIATLQGGAGTHPSPFMYILVGALRRSSGVDVGDPWREGPVLPRALHASCPPGSLDLGQTLTCRICLPQNGPVASTRMGAT